MTRFARSKGSKASNERVPEEATSWQIMKQQLEEKKQEVLENKKRKEFEVTRLGNYKAFLQEKENDIKSEWVEFEGQTSKQNEHQKEKKQKKSAPPKVSSGLENEFKLQNLIEKIEEVLDKDEKTTDNEKKIKKKKSKIAAVVNTDEQSKFQEERTKSVTNETVSSTNHIPNKNANENASGEISKSSKKKKNPKSLKEVPVSKALINKNEEHVNDSVILDEVKQDKLNKNKKKKKKKDKNPEDMTVNQTINFDAIEKSEKPKKKKKRKPKNENDNISTKSKKAMEEMTEDEIKKVNKKKEKKLRQLEIKKKIKAELKEKALKEQENQNIQKRKLPKERDSEEYKRRKPNSQVNKININGVDIDIDYYDGFPVKKDDAERLRKLKKEMISKGIPRSEVFISLKLERRKAEKTLAREKKKVCFNCRKSGHVLSECPDLNENSQEITGTGICFKCGSTEHTHFECKVVRNDNFKYATCFICREQGHISRQCPDNQRGLYPKGGACRECGDVTHLKKDCPKFQEIQESQTVKLDTLEFNNVEDLPDTNRNIRKQENKSKKIVKF